MSSAVAMSDPDRPILLTPLLDDQADAADRGEALPPVAQSESERLQFSLAELLLLRMGPPCISA